MVNLLQYTKTSPYFSQIREENSDRRQNFLEKFGKLSEYIQSFLLSEETANKIAEVRDQYGLNESQGEFLARIIREVVMGNVTSQEAPNFIIKKFNIESALALEINRRLMQIISSVGKEPQTSQTPATSETGNEGNTLNLRQKTGE